MTEQRKEIVGSYLMKEEAMNKIDWLRNEGYRTEEIRIIRDRDGVLEQLGEEPVTWGTDQNHYSNPNSTSSVVSPGSLLTPETKSVSTTLMELGINKEEAYRYEFDVKVGKMLIMVDSVPTSDLSGNGAMADRYIGNEEPALMIDEEETSVEHTTRASRHAENGMVAGSAGYRDELRNDTERHVEIDGRENVVDNSKAGSSMSSGSSINRPLTDANIDGSIPLDEQLLTGEPADVEKVEKDFAREEVISLHDQASVTHEAPTMNREEMGGNNTTTSSEPNNGKRYAENKTEADVDKALLYEHGQPFPMEKPYEEDIYDKNVMADGPLHVEDVPGDTTTTEREKPLFRSDEGTRPTSELEKGPNNSIPEEEKGPILFEDTLNEIEGDRPEMEMEPGMEDARGPIGTEQPGDVYTTGHAESTLGQEEAELHTEGTHTHENETSVFEEENSDPFSSRKKERMNTKRSGLFDTEDDDLFRKGR